jgi:hypothetical protein
LRAVTLRYSSTSIEPGLERFQSEKRSHGPSQGSPLVLRVGQMDLLIPIESLASVRRVGDRTFSVAYGWDGRRHGVEGELAAPTGAYAKYELAGISTTHNTAVTLPLADIQELRFDLPAPSASQERGNLALASATVELKGGGRVPISGLRRVFCSPPYCYHDESLKVAAGAAMVEVPFAALSAIRFLWPTDELKLDYRAGPPETVRPWQGEIFDRQLVGFSGYTELGEVFISASDVAGVEFQAPE